jgi:hypothetical protein
MKPADRPAETMADKLNTLGRVLGIKPDHRGRVTVELEYVDGQFRNARIHTGPIGLDDLDRMNDAA